MAQQQLIEAAEHGQLEVVKLLLKDSRVNPSARNNYAIRLAADKGHLDVVNFLFGYIVGIKTSIIKYSHNQWTPYLKRKQIVIQRVLHKLFENKNKLHYYIINNELVQLLQFMKI